MADVNLRGSTTMTRATNTTAYAIGDVVNSEVASTIQVEFGTEGQRFIILRAMLMIYLNAVPTGMSGFVLHIFSQQPTIIADNSAFNIIAADRSKYLGSISFGTPEDKGDTLVSQIENLTFSENLVESKLYCVLETLGAYTPADSTVFDIRLLGVKA
jgi:hypothetical protein